MGVVKGEVSYSVAILAQATDSCARLHTDRHGTVRPCGEGGSGAVRPVRPYGDGGSGAGGSGAGSGKGDDGFGKGTKGKKGKGFGKDEYYYVPPISEAKVIQVFTAVETLRNQLEGMRDELDAMIETAYTSENSLETMIWGPQ